MTALIPVQFVDENGVKVFNQVLTSSKPTTPDNVVYEFLKRIAGPLAASGETFDLNSNSAGTDTIFNFRVPGDKIFKFSRINFVIVDGSIGPGDFGGIGGGLTDGCLLQIVDSDGVTVLNHFGTDDVPIKTNEDFSPLAGTDVPISALAGDDLLPIRFSVFKAGAPMELTPKQNIRWTNRDDLSALTKFRAMIQGTYK
ncbi:MAG: hypothetical protein ACXABY_27430 [Candidatus Thorarchaeota archaeon]|jgi:hypothetical protein